MRLTDVEALDQGICLVVIIGNEEYVEQKERESKPLRRTCGLIERSFELMPDRFDVERNKRSIHTLRLTYLIRSETEENIGFVSLCLDFLLRQIKNMEKGE